MACINNDGCTVLCEQRATKLEFRPIGGLFERGKTYMMLEESN